MKNLIDPNNHITLEALHDFAVGSLNGDEAMVVAEHITLCEKCASVLAKTVPESRIIIPQGFEEEIQSRISYVRKKKTELLRFSVRIAVAACITLFLALPSGSRICGIAGNPFAQIKAPDFSVVENINTQLQNFSRQLLDMEVLKNDKKAK